jgi:AcrR family transcriptional regulator
VTTGERSDVPGLRERNRARTRADIKASALRLIAEQGYAATTVDQIAKDADVSPSTFFRYFPTKEDAVLVDDYDPVMIKVFRDQPAELSPIEALRHTIRDVFHRLPESESAQEAERIRILLAVPELRDRMLGSLAQSLVMMAGLIGERVGRSPEDPDVQHFAGAVTGVATAAMFRAAADPDLDWLDAVDESLKYLEDGLPL